ncbi:MAG TPA: TIGR01777 family oxidoreductase, partial [Ferruginibacter sp.]|nr:TIGR01777 family oxidoreductase [Ferruginibacter sp.]
GAGVADKRWTSAYKKEILDSRLQSTALLAKALQESQHHVRTFLSASAIGWYGQDRPDHQPFIETDPAATDFLGDTCRQWEQAVDAIASQGIRTCKLRTGIVLGLGGGALKEYDLPLKLGIAPILGSGKQMLSWIHIRDLCRMYLYLLKEETLTGVFNAVAPNPVNNETFGLTLARTRNKKRFIPLPVPAFVLKLVKGESSIEVLKSTTVSANKIKTAGFVFQFPTVPVALENIYSAL